MLGVSQQGLCLGDLLAANVVRKSHTGLPLEARREKPAAHKERLRNVLGADGLKDVTAHVVGHAKHQLGRVLAKAQMPHALGVFYRHVVAQLAYLLRVACKLATIDIRVAKGEGLVRIHPAGNCRARNHSHACHKGVLRVA